MDFLAYFKTKLDTKDQKWIRVYDHFSNYCGGVCKMGDITVPFCEGFREYLLNAKQLKHPDKQLAQNSAAGYWSTFRGFLKIAYQGPGVRLPCPAQLHWRGCRRDFHPRIGLHCARAG